MIFRDAFLAHDNARSHAADDVGASSVFSIIAPRSSGHALNHKLVMANISCMLVECAVFAISAAEHAS